MELTRTQLRRRQRQHTQKCLWGVVNSIKVMEPEVRHRLAAIRPCIEALQAASRNQVCRTPSQVVSRDVVTMRNYAEHHFQDSIVGMDPRTARQLLRSGKNRARRDQVVDDADVESEAVNSWAASQKDDGSDITEPSKCHGEANADGDDNGSPGGYCNTCGVWQPKLATTLCVYRVRHAVQIDSGPQSAHQTDAEVNPCKADWGAGIPGGDVVKAIADLGDNNVQQGKAVVRTDETDRDAGSLEGDAVKALRGQSKPISIVGIGWQICSDSVDFVPGRIWHGKRPDTKLKFNSSWWHLQMYAAERAACNAIVDGMQDDNVSPEVRAEQDYEIESDGAQLLTAPTTKAVTHVARNAKQEKKRLKQKERRRKALMTVVANDVQDRTYSPLGNGAIVSEGADDERVHVKSTDHQSFLQWVREWYMRGRGANDAPSALSRDAKRRLRKRLQNENAEQRLREAELRGPLKLNLSHEEDWKKKR